LFPRPHLDPHYLHNTPPTRFCTPRATCRRSTVFRCVRRRTHLLARRAPRPTTWRLRTRTPGLDYSPPPAIPGMQPRDSGLPGVYHPAGMNTAALRRCPAGSVARRTRGVAAAVENYHSSLSGRKNNISPARARGARTLNARHAHRAHHTLVPLPR